MKLLPHLRAVWGLREDVLLLKPPTQHWPEGFTSVSQVYYLFRARNNESSGRLWALVVNVSSHHVKDKSSMAAAAVRSGSKHPGKEWKTPVGHSAETGAAVRQPCQCCTSSRYSRILHPTNCYSWLGESCVHYCCQNISFESNSSQDHCRFT